MELEDVEDEGGIAADSADDEVEEKVEEERSNDEGNDDQTNYDYFYI